MHGYLLLTGATGLIGRYLLLDLLQSNSPLAVIVRPQGSLSGRDRIERIVDELEHDFGMTLPRPVCLEGDIASPGLGLNAESQAWARRNCGRLLHNAASVTFEGDDRDQEPWRSNLNGARQVLNFAAACEIGELHWVSTAYVCGRRRGKIWEADCHNGDGFRNAYEHSKIEAELLVRNATGVDSLTVYRPSIVVGDSSTGYTNSYHNIYLFLQFTHILSQAATRQADGRWHHPVRLTFSGDEALNLVPVDWVAGAIARIARNPMLHGRTYHLTHPEPTTCGAMEAALSRYFNYYGVEFVGPHGIPPGEATELEQMFYTALAAHDSYWNEHPDFDCGNTQTALPEWPCPRIDVPNLLRLFEFAIRHNFGKKRRQVRSNARERIAER